MGETVAPARHAPGSGITRGTRRSWPLQADFALVAVLVVLVGAAGGVFVHLRSDADAKQSAQADANFAASRAAAQLQKSLDVLRTVSASIAGGPSVSQIFADASRCTLSYAPIGAFDAGHVDFVRSDGPVVCSSLKSGSAATYAGQPWLQSSTPVVIAPTLDPAGGRQVAVYAYPIPGHGFLVWFLDLTSLGQKLGSDYGSGVNQLEFLVVGRDGAAIVARSIDSARWTGVTIAGTSFAGATDPVERKDVDGRARWYGEATVATAGWTVYAGADEAAAHVDAARLQNQQLVIAGAGVGAVLLALYVVRRRAVIPLERLSRSVRASRGLDSSTLVTVGGPSEVAGLGEEINHLITTLNREWRERENVQQSYMRLFDGSPLPIMFSDPATGKFLEVNYSAAALFGYSREELFDVAAGDMFVLPADREAIGKETLRQESAGANLVRYGPVAVRKKDGAAMNVLVTSYQVTYAGRPARVSMVEDVTERERLERQLNQSQRLESLGQLAGGIAHDFNNLLGVILNFALFAREKVLASGDAATGANLQLAVKDLDRVTHAAESAARLTHQLLAFARREVMRPEAIDIDSVIADLEPLVGRTIGEHIEFITSPGNGLWPALMDPGQLEQVLTNLAVNARDAMPDGGKLAIDCENVYVDLAYAAGRAALKPGRYVRIRVTDTGTGMDAATLQRVFEPFFTTKPKGQGTGLGLATVYGIVNQAGGDISIYSEVGVGTRVHVLLPASDSAPMPAESEPAPARDQASATILVVEDADDLREITELILTRNGYRVITASNGPEALEVVKQRAGGIDLLLTDVVMPLMQGRELAQQIEAMQPGVRVLFMSGYAQPILGAGGALDDGVLLLEKPFTEPALLAKVEEALRPPPMPPAVEAVA
jgi:PAS domain S-box-containing protein